jgi:hypothetical protein
MNWDDNRLGGIGADAAAFLAGTAGARTIGGRTRISRRTTTFAQRIGWKWDFVLAELQRAAGRRRRASCWTGVAAVASRGGHFWITSATDAVTKLRVWDRSSLAMAFAAQRAQQKYPKLAVEPRRHAGSVGGTLLISHVLTELTQEQTEALVEQAALAQCVIWVEPGTYEASLTLIAIRERLRKHFNSSRPAPIRNVAGFLLRRTSGIGVIISPRRRRRSLPIAAGRASPICSGSICGICR